MLLHNTLKLMISEFTHVMLKVCVKLAAYLSNMDSGSSVVEQMPAKGMVVSSSLTRSVGFPTAWPLCRQRRKFNTYFEIVCIIMHNYVSKYPMSTFEYVFLPKGIEKGGTCSKRDFCTVTLTFEPKMSWVSIGIYFWHFRPYLEFLTHSLRWVPILIYDVRYTPAFWPSNFCSAV